MKKIILPIVFILLLFVPIVCLAQIFDNPVPSTTDIPNAVGNVLRTVLGIVGVIALLLFIWAGFVWMTAQGSPDKIGKARTVIVWTSIALLILFSSYVILRFIFDLDFIPK